MSNSSNNEAALMVQTVCSCSQERALELIEAGGSVDRAVDIHFSQQAQPQQSSSEQEPPARAVQQNRKRSNSETIADSATKRIKKDDDNKIETRDSSSGSASLKSQESSSPLRSPSKTSSSYAQPRLSSFFSPGGTDNRKKSPPVANATTAQEDTSRVSQKSSRDSKATILKAGDNDDDTNDERLHYSKLAETFSIMADTTKRLKKLDALKQVLSGVINAIKEGTTSDDAADGNNSIDDNTRLLYYATELILGCPSLKLQVSGAAVSKAVQSVTGATSSQLRTSYRSKGDLGDVAQGLLRNQQRLLVQPKALTIRKVYTTLQQVQAQEGKGSQTQRQTLMVKLLRSCQKSSELRFLVRTLLGNMRLGANTKSVLAALAMAISDSSDSKTSIKTVQDTFDYCPRLDKICGALLVGGIPHMIETCTLEVGTCINPMLANPAHSLEEVEAMMRQGGPAIAEYKYDGVRCQAHCTGGTNMVLYSRHMLENTEQFPDAVSYFLEAKHSKVQSFIIDSEIVGIERDATGGFRLLPFQDLSTRRGTKNDDALPIHIFAFDLMFLNGESLVQKPLHVRQRLLRQHFHDTDGFSFAQSIALPLFDTQAITTFLRSAVAGGAEGLMIKLTGASNSNSGDDGSIKMAAAAAKVDDDKFSFQYESGVRSHTWLKVKRDYVAGFSDTIDVVPIGAWYGNGRKAQKGFLSPVLLAVYDEEEDVFRSICRCMSFTDAMYSAMKEFYLNGVPYPAGVGLEEEEAGQIKVDADTEDAQVDMSVDMDTEAVNLDGDNDDEEASEGVNCYPSRPAALTVTNESPSIWFKPSEVFEISFADLTLSKQHSAAAGLVDPSRGVALRFPRFKRRRPDKRIDQATTTAQVAELFKKQAKLQPRSSKVA